MFNFIILFDLRQPLTAVASVYMSCHAQFYTKK